ncbi:MAG: ROK family protein [Campylobacterota bacterium]|nr:ROK family protein [Campylobacterota bacterium]
MHLTIDYGGTNFRYQLGDSDIITLPSQSVELMAFLHDNIAKYPIKSIALSFAGQVREGEILSAPNIALQNLNIKQTIEQKYGIPLAIDNDLKCAARYENKIHSDANTIAVLYIGTGFGATLIDGDKIISGHNNFAGEIGHIPYKTTPFQCGCGRDDCLELTLSGSALHKWVEHYRLDLPSLTLQNLQSNKQGEQIYQNFLDALAHSFFTILNLFDPDCFIYGGSVIGHNPKLIDYLKECYNNSSFSTIRKAPQILVSSSDNGALEGAKLLHKENRL